MTRLRKNGHWILASLAILIGIAGFYIFLLNRNTIVPPSWVNPAGPRDSLAQLLNTFVQALILPIVTSVLGILIIRRYPTHRVGWLFFVIALISAFSSLVAEIAVYGYFTTAQKVAGIEWFGWITNWIWIILFGLLLSLLAIFPNGQFINPTWRKVFIALMSWFALFLIVGSAIEPSMTSAFQIENPLAVEISSEISNLFFLSGLPALPLTAVALMISFVARFRQGRGRERQQMKWLLVGVALMALMVVIGIPLSFVGNSKYPELMVNASVLAPMAGIGVALLRYHLYDIDIIIRRTLVYTMVSAMLGFIYLGSVVLLQGLITAVGGEQSTIVVAISTLVIAALFNPVRGRVQTIVDQRFYRQKYNAAQTLNQFAALARDEVNLQTLTQALSHAVEETMHPQEMTFWLKSENAYRNDFGNG